jgi:hypothetical protein
MRRFKSSGHAQRFVEVAGHHRLRFLSLDATCYLLLIAGALRSKRLQI